MKNENITVVVVTYNRKRLLKECLTALLSQTHKLDLIIIIDNASTDGTENMLRNTFLDNKIFDYTKLEKNIGGAGGFHYGIKKAYEKGYDWIWVMDDDCISQNDSLSRLLEAKNFLIKNNEDIGFLASNAFWTNGNLCEMNIGEVKKSGNEYKYLEHKIIELGNASFVSVIISRESVAIFGLPIKDLFIWLDDYEYTKRITKEKKGFLVGNSKVIHKTKTNFSVDYSKFTSGDLWKYKIETRNYIYLLKTGVFRKQGVFRVINNFKKLIFSKNSKYFPIILYWSIKGLFFKPKIDRV